MQRLTEIKKEGEKARAAAIKKGAANRPTRDQASKECVIS